MLRIELVRSIIAQRPVHKATIKALGLRKIRQAVEKQNVPTILGMVHTVRHMVKVTDLETGKILVDATLIKRNAHARDHKPSETH
jgi:large subunit ribosomal protein L30